MTPVTFLDFKMSPAADLSLFENQYRLSEIEHRKMMNTNVSIFFFFNTKAPSKAYNNNIVLMLMLNYIVIVFLYDIKQHV